MDASTGASGEEGRDAPLDLEWDCRNSSKSSRARADADADADAEAETEEALCDKTQWSEAGTESASTAAPASEPAANGYGLPEPNAASSAGLRPGATGTAAGEATERRGKGSGAMKGEAAKGVPGEGGEGTAWRGGVGRCAWWRWAGNGAGSSGEKGGGIGWGTATPGSGRGDVARPAMGDCEADAEGGRDGAPDAAKAANKGGASNLGGVGPPEAPPNPPDPPATAERATGGAERRGETRSLPLCDCGAGTDFFSSVAVAVSLSIEATAFDLCLGLDLGLALDLGLGLGLDLVRTAERSFRCSRSERGDLSDSVSLSLLSASASS